MRRWRSRGALPMRPRIIPTLEHILDVIARLAVDHRLTVYDAAYLDLALREGLPLASLDDRLRTAAGNVGVPLV